MAPGPDADDPVVTPAPIALISMPWESIARPSLALGTLSALARRAGHECSSLYLNLEFASAIGTDLYVAFAETLDLFPLGEHLFACDLFGSDRLGSDAYLASFGSPADADAQTSDPLRLLRDVEIPRFLSRASSQVALSRLTTVGFTCTFNQLLPSLALARRLKQLNPNVTIIFGGASVHSSMGLAYIEAFPQWIDYVFLGEADESFVAWLDSYTAGGPMPAIAGVAQHGSHLPARFPEDLDASPVPDFDGFFAQRDALERLDGSLPHVRHLPYESSRGCWWGERRHCTFCGLNNEGMRYRRRSTQRVVSELEEQSKRYGITSFMAADNILDFRAYGDLLERLADAPVEYDLFYEIKSSVRRDDVAKLRRAGVWRIQPGIESFSDHVLELMRKGVSGLRNVQLLKWAQEFGITVEYNILVGFPGEVPADYNELLRIIKTIHHLTPPNGAATEVRVDRFSPFFDYATDLGIRGLQAAWYYRHLIPTEILAPERYAYFFDRDVEDVDALRPDIRLLNAAIADWKASTIHKRARLGAGFVEVQTFETGRMRRKVLRGMDAAVFVTSDSQVAVGALERQLAPAAGTIADVHAAVDYLVMEGILLRVGDNVVGVVPFAVPHGDGQLQRWAQLNGYPLSRRRLELAVTAAQHRAAP